MIWIWEADMSKRGDSLSSSLVKPPSAAAGDGASAGGATLELE